MIQNDQASPCDNDDNNNNNNNKNDNKSHDNNNNNKLILTSFRQSLGVCICGCNNFADAKAIGSLPTLHCTKHSITT